MRKLLAAILVTISSIAFADLAVARGSGSHSGGYHSVRSYTTKNGTYVAPHYQTNPNGTKTDNWSTKGNANPFTGKPGTKNQ